MEAVRKYLPVLLAVLLLGGCAGGASEKDIADTLNFDVWQGTVMTQTDTHGGFFGDGETVLTVSFDEDMSGLLEKTAGWDPMPLPQNLSVVLYGGMSTDGKNWNALLTDEDGVPLVPAVTNGFYFFLDRHSESLDSGDPSALLSRASLNFTLAVYDADRQMLYFYRLDT